MPEQVAHTEDLVQTAYDASRATADRDPGAGPADAGPGAAPVDGISTEPLPVPGEDTDVGLAQKGTGEDAVVRRETEI